MLGYFWKFNDTISCHCNTLTVLHIFLRLINLENIVPLLQFKNTYIIFVWSVIYMYINTNSGKHVSNYRWNIRVCIFKSRKPMTQYTNRGVRTRTSQVPLYYKGTWLVLVLTPRNVRSSPENREILRGIYFQKLRLIYHWVI